MVVGSQAVICTKNQDVEIRSRFGEPQAKQMGHTDWSLTAKRYSRWITSDMPDAGQKAVRLWSQLGHNPAVSDSKESGEGGFEPSPE